jgi:threonine aldolase
MRQAGILAAAGIVALTEMVDRLADDHANARKLAEGLANISGISIHPETVKSNIVFFEVVNGLSARDLADRLNDEGVRVLPLDPVRLRAVTHYHITLEDIDRALKIFTRVLKTA